MGLQDAGSWQIELWEPGSGGDPGFTRLKKLKDSQAAGVFSVQLSSGLIACFRAYVTSLPVQSLTPDSAVGRSATLRITNTFGEFA